MAEATTTEQSPAESRLLTAAQVKLRNFEKLHPIRFFQAGDNEELCGVCMVGLVRGTDGWRHNPAEVRRLRELASDGQWPNRRS